MSNVMMSGPGMRAVTFRQDGRQVYAEDGLDQVGERETAQAPPQVFVAFGDLSSAVKALHGVIDEFESRLAVVMSQPHGGPEAPATIKASTQRFEAPLAANLDGVGEDVNLAKRRLLAMLGRIEL